MRHFLKKHQSQEKEQVANKIIARSTAEELVLGQSFLNAFRRKDFFATAIRIIDPARASSLFLRQNGINSQFLLHLYLSG